MSVRLLILAVSVAGTSGSGDTGTASLSNL
jgi:hypothetical protein